MAQNTPQNNTNSIPFEQLKNEAGLIQLFKLFEEKLAYNVFNCVRVGIVEEYNPETRTAKIKIANKLVTGVNSDGTQKTQDYAPIYAKVWFFGWGDKGITHPILQGQEAIVIFADREIESWYINGAVNPLAHKRAHSLSDAIAIIGLSSLPNITPTEQNSLNIYYKETSIKLDEENIKIKNDIISDNKISANGIIDTTGATGYFVSQDNKTIKVENGIIKSIE